MVGLLLPLAPRAEAETEVSLNFFYDNLSPYGNWIDVGGYGYAFQPSVAVSNRDWRPYSDGYWAYTDVGWTWVSYEDFGWATYHYGRWADLDDYGWVWVPGYEWGPAWVSWRTGGDYVGWAPLPPQPNGVVYEGRAITGAVDVSFNIGPLYYNFVDIRYIGEPVLRGRILPPRRNVTIINRTVNVTNITYNNSIVINHGPDLARIDRYSSRPIQRLKLERETNANFKGRRGNLNRVNGNALLVAAPAVQRSKEKIAPRQVKAKVEKPNVQRGWQGVNNRPQIEAAMKKENAKNVPPPSFQPQKGHRGQNAAAQPNESEQAGQNRPAKANQQREERQARQKEQAQKEQQAQQENAQKSNQKAQRAEERQAREKQQAAQKEEQRRKAQQAKEEQKARQAEQDQARQKAGKEQRAQHQEKAQREQQQAEAQRAERARRQAEQEQARQKAGKEQHAQRQEKAQREQQQAEAQRAERARRQAEQERAQKPEKAQKRERPAQPQRARPAERPNRPEKAQRAQPDRRPQQARPNQGQGQNDEERARKAKKKKRGDDEPKP